MGGIVTRLYLARPPGDDASWRASDEGLELFYELRDLILRSIFAKMTRTASWNMRSYLQSEDFFVQLSEGARRGGPAEVLPFSLWEEGHGISPDLALHAFTVVMALDVGRLDARVKAAGGAIDRARHDLAEVMGRGPGQPFVVLSPGKGSARHSQISLWARDQAVDQLPQLTPAPRFDLQPPEALQQMRAMAMTGWCRCELCTVVRARRRMAEPSLDDAVPRAWEALQRDPEGALLADRAAAALELSWTDTEGSDVLGDWLSDRSIEVARPLLPGLARTFGRPW
jgi:hypothetical protein